MFTFNNAEYKVVARTTNDFGEVAEIAVNDNGELALRKFTYNSVGEPTDIKIKALDKSKITIFQQGDFSLLFHNSLTLIIMIPNIIKTIIKDIPSVANSSIRLMNENRDRGQFTFVTTDAKAVAIVLTNVPKGAPKSISAHKKQMIADFLYLVAVEGDHMCTSEGKKYTLADIAKEIDLIISQDVVLWDMEENGEYLIIED